MNIGFAGTPDFACPVFEMLTQNHTISFVLTQPDRPRGRGQKVQPSPIKKYAEKARVTIYQPEKLTIEPWQHILKKHPIDVLVVVSYGLYIPQWLIDHPKYGCINIHPSLLPRWRGASPIHAALLNGDGETGVCIMRIVKEMDAGPVFKTHNISITQLTEFQTLHDDLAQLGTQMLQQVLQDLPDIEPKPQAKEGITHAEKLNKQSNWYNPEWSAHQLHCHIQAFHPKPGVQATFDNKTIKLVWGMPSNIKSIQTPGHITFHKNHWSIATTTEDYHLTHIQWAGKKTSKINSTSVIKNNHPQITRPQKA